MKMNDEKERNDRIEKLIQLLSENGTCIVNRDLSALIADDHCHNKHQTEDDYQKEQAAWLESVKRKKKP